MPQPAIVAPAQVPVQTQPIEKRLSEIQDELAQCDQLAFRQQGAQISLKAQAAAYADLSSQIAKQQQDLRQQVAQADEAAAAIESTRQFWQKQLEAVLSCQMLSRTARIAEEELALARQMAGMLSQSRQRLVDEQTHYDQRCVQLQELTEHLGAQLKQALAETQSMEKPHE
jgi:chromosome segregation ATPase